MNDVDDASDEEIRRLDRQVEAARAIQRRLDVAVAKREAGPDERRLAAAYLGGRITLMPEAVEALRRLGLVVERRGRGIIATMNEPGQTAITIREARPDEFEAIGEIVVAAYRTLGTEPDDYVEYLRDTAARADAGIVLAALDDSGTVLGTVTYVPGPATPLSEIERENEGGFRALAVAPTAHGRGVGRALVAAVIGRARAKGRVGVAMYTRPSMKAAQHLYESIGFHREPTQDWSFAPDEWLWAYRLKF